MAKVGKIRLATPRSKKRQPSASRISPTSHKIALKKKKHHTASPKKDWEDATCSVCMESPHNAVLLLCSSYNHGCRPYMCATGYRFSNCLDQYKKAYTKLSSLQTKQPLSDPSFGSGFPFDEVPRLSCPVCRGQVKGWTVVKQPRKELNRRKRSCLEENCSFVGDYKRLKKHVKAKHPLSRPRDVDPALEEKWKALERERERRDVISAITSSDPGAVVYGDFVIEGGQNSFYREFGDGGGILENDFFRYAPFGSGLGFVPDRQLGRVRGVYEDDDIGVWPDRNDQMTRRRRRRLLFERANRRSRNREY